MQKAIEHLEAEVWVVDNASSDNSIHYLQAKFPWVNFKANLKNVGFAKANNQVLNECRGKYILFLNPDTLIPEDSLTGCITFMETKTDTGALGIRMIDGTGAFLPESKRAFPSPLTSLYKMVGLSSLFPTSAIFSRYYLPYLNEYENCEVDVLSGAFMLVRKNVLTELKGFDEAFFMYGEDIDLSYRIQKLGYKNYYFGSSTIIHFKGESTRRGSLKYVKIFYKAMSIFVKKHYAGKSAHLFTSFLHLAIWLRASASAISPFGLQKGSFLFNSFNKSGRSEKKIKTIKKRNKILVAGTKEECEEVKTLLANGGLGEITIEHLYLNAENKNELAAISNPYGATEIIFCSEKLSYSWIIDKIQHLPKKISFRFHAKGTGSIVGSDFKNTTGIVVAARKREQK